MAAPIGAVVSISPYDWGLPEPPPAEGDYLLSGGGSMYRILAARASGSTPGRLHYRCLKVDEVPPEARVERLHWYPRDKRRG